MRAKELVTGLGRFGPTTQATVAGTYAWATTVLPFAWSHGSSGLSQIGAALALLALLAGPLVDRFPAGRARPIAFWGFILACAFAWLAAPGALAPLRVDVFRGVTGTIGWMLFAFAWAAPAIGASEGEPAAVDDEPLVPRRRPVGRQGYALLGAGVLAAAVQVVGWEVPNVERFLLVRVVDLVGGLAVIDSAARVVLARHPGRGRNAVAVPLRAARGWLVALGLLAVVAAVIAIRG
jgi:hypothetical protein